MKSHGHRGGQGVLVKGKGTWAPGPSPGAPWAGPRPMQAWAQGAAAGEGPCSCALGPCLDGAHGAHVPLPMSQGIQRLLRPPCGHVFSQEVWKSYQMYKSRVLLCEAPKLLSGFLTFSPPGGPVTAAAATAATTEEFPQTSNPPFPSHPGMKYPVRANPSLRYST